MRTRPFPTTLVVLIIAIVIAHYLATFYYWYWLFPWLDMVMHTISGAWFAGAVLWWMFFSRNPVPTVSFTRIFTLGVGSALAVGVLWEVYGVAVAFLSGVPPNALPDTLSDIFFGGFGGLLTVLFVRRFIHR